MSNMPSIDLKRFGLYIGCQTNKGKLVGLVEDKIYTQLPGKDIEQHEINGMGSSVKLLLKRINNLSAEESDQLIRKGFSIGRPNGYSFSPEAILYLTSLGVDLFGLIESGYAEELESKKI
jgi:hypothetical protein